MFAIVYCHRKRVAEYSGRLLETDVVFGEIIVRLGGVPRELIPKTLCHASGSHSTRTTSHNSRCTTQEYCANFVPGRNRIVLRIKLGEIGFEHRQALQVTDYVKEKISPYDF